MVMANAYEKYKTQEVSTAGPGALIVMLYTGCIKQLKLARMAVDKKAYEEANVSFKKAQDILSELMTSLDFRYEISQNLLSLYDFMYREIVSANIRKEAKGIEPVVKMLSELREAWVQVEKTCKPAPLEEMEV